MSKRVLSVLLADDAGRRIWAHREAHGDDPDVIFEWNGLLQGSLALPPPMGVPPAGLQGFRFYAMLHVAMFDAVNSIEERYRAVSTCNVRASHGASSEAAAAQAAHDVLAVADAGKHGDLRRELARALATIPPGRSAQGVRVGKKVAEQIIEWRLKDGWSTPPPPVRTCRRFQDCGSRRLPASGRRLHTASWHSSPFALLTNTQFLHPAPPTLTSTQVRRGLQRGQDRRQSPPASRTAARPDPAGAALGRGDLRRRPLNADLEQRRARHRNQTEGWIWSRPRAYLPS